MKDNAISAPLHVSAMRWSFLKEPHKKTKLG